MVIWFVLGLAVVLLVGLVTAEMTENPKWILLFKTPLSLLFIVAWTLQPALDARFAGLILLALLFCLGGDILLAFGSRGTFLLGLASFLLGHLSYALAFFAARSALPAIRPFPCVPAVVCLPAPSCSIFQIFSWPGSASSPVPLSTGWLDCPFTTSPSFYWPFPPPGFPHEANPFYQLTGNRTVCLALF
ncbi:MAG: lysoplasmalogenase family protein [Desulfobacteraceae bacterium]|nr:lysoplasmalogenase family protein [Desulfobacteraceae bacterium]